MDITAELDAMRAEIEGCAMVAFTDLTSQLVLCSSSATKPVQEEMNALSEAAHQALDGAFAEGASGSWDSDVPAELAVLLTESEARLVLRSPQNPSEALVCVCGADADLEGAVQTARATLERLVAAS